MLTSLFLLATVIPAAPADGCPSSVVRITNEHGSGLGLKTEGGTGVVVHATRSSSLIVTNRHVVDSGGRLHAYCPGRSWYGRARLVRYADRGDLAVLRVDAELPAAPLAADAPAGTDLTLWGFPHGVTDPARKTGRLGRVEGTILGLDALTTTVRSEDGDSGGPQFDARGRVVCLSITSAGSTVPAGAVRALVDQVLRAGK